MKAAVVHSATEPPLYETFADPTPQGDEVMVRVLAAGLHPLVRMIASGKHYTSTRTYPLIPGVDGIGELPDGRRVYFGFLRPPYGTFAEQAVVLPPICLNLPDGLDPVLAAGITNPGMSSYAALSVRGQFQSGESVLVLGATGSAGQLAIQIARALGARRVVAAGRNTQVLGQLPVDATLRLDQPEFADALRSELTTHRVDVVLDYVWGTTAETALTVLSSKEAHIGARRVRFVQIGETGGAVIRLPAAVLRSTAIELLGSGLGSVAPTQLNACIGQVLRLAGEGALRLPVEKVPLSQVETAWQKAGEGRRVVFVP
jgi:NADPH2:quinone reductase